MLVTMLTSPETMSTIKLSGVRVFAKMTCTHSVIYTAYKKGLKLVSESLEDDLLIALLVSLSKLASKLTLLASEQIDLLLLFLAQGKTSHIQAVALRCLHFIVIKGMCYPPASEHVTRTLISMLVKPELPLVMQFDALEILEKILSYKLCPVDMLGFAQLLTIVEKAPQCSTISKNPRAIRALANVAIKILEAREIRHAEVSSSPLLLQIITLIIDGISFLGQSTANLCQNHFGEFQEVQSLLNLLLLIIGEHSDLGVLVLDKVSLLLENFVNMQSRTTNRQPAPLIHQMNEKGKGASIIRSKLILYINRFLVVCLETLNLSGAPTSQVFDKVKLVVERVRGCDSYAELLYSMLLHSPVIWSITVNEERKTCNFDETSGTCLLNYSSEHEIFTLECAKKMLMEKNYWLAYRAGIHAAGQGGWVTAAFIFGQLRIKVQSDSCICWLKSLAEFTLSEGEIQLLLLPKGSSILVDWLKKNQSPKTPFQDVAANNEGNYGKVFLGAFHLLCSSKEILESIDASRTTFYFQIWFLAVRTRVIGTIVDLLEVLRMYNPSNLRKNGDLEKSKLIQCNSLQQITQISISLKTLAQDLDLIATSFIDMDEHSLKIIAAFALSCSILAFTAGFALSIPKLHNVQNGLESSQNNLQSLLVQNLVRRLWQIDPEISQKLYQLLEAHGQPKSCFHIRSRNQILSIGGEVRDILSLCNYAVSGIARMQNEVSEVHVEDTLSNSTKDGLHLMMDVIMKWIHIPFQIPKRFFRVRPCIGSELYAFDADTRNSNGLFVISGFHLSLNLCLQLRNIPSEVSSKVTKLYCILYSKPSFRISREDGKTKERTKMVCSAWEDDEIVEMNEKLFHYVTGQEKKMNDSSNAIGVTYAYVCFEASERGQGFSNCLLDVSCFPVGSYQIKWHSCCIDRQGSYWTLISLNSGPIFSVRK
ncbi:uncharacterized protein LOC110817385 isoform X2 [Carica papaya]|nr:uncharacterized protein LOC110817385 isoform X2 [Carica papaya]